MRHGSDAMSRLKGYEDIRFVWVERGGDLDCAPPILGFCIDCEGGHGAAFSAAVADVQLNPHGRGVSLHIPLLQAEGQHAQQDADLR